MPESLISSVVWEGGDLPLMELASLWRADDGYAITGTVVGVLSRAGIAVRYRVECAATWQTRRARVELTHAGQVRELLVEVDEEGRWAVDGVERPDLLALQDVDIQATPSTNILPIRRLALEVGEEAAVTAAWIQVPAMTVTPLRQRYRRVGEGLYEYRSDGFRAALRVDEEGLVERYGSYWRRFGYEGGPEA